MLYSTKHVKGVYIGFLAAISLTAIFLSGCKKEGIREESTMVATDVPTASKKADIIVSPGQSIQAAITAATPNSVIRIQPGTYIEALVVEKAGITLEGNGAVTLQNPGGVNNGITVRDAGDGFILKNITITNFLRNGVFLIRVDNFLLSHVTAINDGEYGLFPIFCTNGTIEHCEASGHDDTGIYVGQSSDIAINKCEAHENVNGIEIENCTSVTADKNHSYNNTAGMLVVLLPGLTTKTGNDVVVTNNHLENNNHVNFAEPGGFEAFVPSGSGLLIVGSDGTIAANNKINNNNFVGVAVVSTLLLGSLAGLPPIAFADIEPNPDGTKVINNVLNNNGSAPPVGLPLPGADLLWDGSGLNNCWSSNNYSTSVPAALPVCNEWKIFGWKALLHFSEESFFHLPEQMGLTDSESPCDWFFTPLP